MLSEFFTHAQGFVLDALTSYHKLFVICIFVGFPVPFPEDIIVMTVGTLVAAGELDPIPATLACGAGMFVRDLNAFLFARRFSHWMLNKPRVRRLIGEKNILRWSRLFATRGALGIFMVRFAVGTRVKLFFIAAALGVRVRTFVIFDLLGMCIVAPLLVWLGYRFGQPMIDGVERAMAYSGPLITAVVLVLFAVVMVRWRRSTSNDESDEDDDAVEAT